MHIKRILAKAVGAVGATIKSIRQEKDCVIIECACRKGQNVRCPHCNKKCPVYDHLTKARRWRALDLGEDKVYLECDTLRITCPEHGINVAAVPWAEPDSRFTRSFEQQIAWLCVNCCRSSVAHLMRINWKSVGPICAREHARLETRFPDRFDSLRRIGIDETSYKKGHKYMTVIVDHDTNSVVWCEKGYGKAVLESFFEQLTEEQRANIEVVTADGARWIAEVVKQTCPNAERIMDPFHVVGWMTDVLDGIRVDAWKRARKADAAQPKYGRGRPKLDEVRLPSTAKTVKGSRYALLKNPEDLTESQEVTLAAIAREDKILYRAYLLKERLRDVFKSQDAFEARQRLEAWLKSACHSGCKAIRELSKKVRRHKEAIIRAVSLGISNARVEAINNKIKLTVRMGYGFRNFDNLKALVMLRCSGLPVELPGRA